MNELYSLSAENSVIGSLLLKNESFEQIKELKLNAIDFYSENNRLVYSVISEFIDKKESFDVIILSQHKWLKGKKIAGITALSYLSALARDTPSVANIHSYASLVKQFSVKRQLISISAEISNKILSGENATDLIAELNRLSKPISSSILDSDPFNSNIDLLSSIGNAHILKQLSLQIAKARELPANSVFLIGLGVFSSMSCRQYVVDYAKGKSLPIGLYVIAEQPSGVGKTSCIDMFQRPFFDIYHDIAENKTKRLLQLKKRLNEDGILSDAENAELDELESEELIKPFITNATPEGLENTLSSSQGFFSAISSEQGLFNSLFGGRSYAGANNDIALNGFDGGYVAFGRVTRKGFVGNAAGAIVCFAQQGSIDTVLEAGSTGIGLSERFLMLSEPHRLGQRDRKAMFLGENFTDFSVYNAYNSICRELFDALENPQLYRDLAHLSMSMESYEAIGDYLNSIEPHLGNSEALSHSTLRGATGKIDMQIMKIAANLHLLDDGFYKSTIEHKHVLSAIKIADELIMYQVHLLQNKGVMGAKAEVEAILAYFNHAKKQATEREICQAKRNVKPFKGYTGNVSELIRNTINQMVEEGLLLKTEVDKKIVYSLGQ